MSNCAARDVPTPKVRAIQPLCACRVKPSEGGKKYAGREAALSRAHRRVTLDAPRLFFYTMGRASRPEMRHLMLTPEHTMTTTTHTTSRTPLETSARDFVPLAFKEPHVCR